MGRRALLASLGETLPLLLTPAQEQHLWQEILKEFSFLLKDGAAQQCREAWRLMHQWRIGAGAGNEDALAFSSWSQEIQAQPAGTSTLPACPTSWRSTSAS